MAYFFLSFPVKYFFSPLCVFKSVLLDLADKLFKYLFFIEVALAKNIFRTVSG